MGETFFPKKVSPKKTTKTKTPPKIMSKISVSKVADEAASKNHLGILAKYAVFFALFFLLARGFDFLMSPFAAGLFIALILSQQNILGLIPLYILAMLLALGFSVDTFFVFLPPVLVASVALYVLSRNKKAAGPLVYIVTAFLASLPIFFFNRHLELAQYILYSLFGILLTMLSALAFGILSRAIFYRRVKKLELMSINEKASVTFLILGTFLGLYSLQIAGDAYIFFAAAIFFVTLFIGANSPAAALVVAASAGVGALLASGQIIPLGLIALLFCVAYLLFRLNKYLVCLAGAIVYFALFAGGIIYPFDIVAAIIFSLSAASVLAVPKKIVAGLSHMTNTSRFKSQAGVSIVNNSRLIMERRLWGLAQAFKTTASVIASADKGHKQQQQQQYQHEQRQQHYQQHFQTDSAAEYFHGVGSLFTSLSEYYSGALSHNSELEMRLKDALLSQNIICKDIAVYKDKSSLQALLIISEKDIDNPALSQKVQSILGANMAVSAVDLPFRGYAAIEFSAESKYEVIYGAAYAKHAGYLVSGDVKSALKVSNKFIAAICDGMGHGNNAQMAGEAAVSLVESFYRTGMTDSVILPLINGALAGSGGDTFTSLDMCVVDLKTGGSDLIKMGASDSYIKRKNGEIERIEGAALPLGAMSGSKPSITHLTLYHDDFVILISDGITDVLDDNAIYQILDQTKTKNPQALADTILSHAQYAKAKDDLSVLVMRLYERV